MYDAIDAAALETSLVEWKRQEKVEKAMRYTYLGNFLSGMETCRARKIPTGRRAPLETSLVEWKPPGHNVYLRWAKPWKLP